MLKSGTYTTLVLLLCVGMNSCGDGGKSKAPAEHGGSNKGQDPELVDIAGNAATDADEKLPSLRRSSRGQIRVAQEPDLGAINADSTLVGRSLQAAPKVKQEKDSTSQQRHGEALVTQLKDPESFAEFLGEFPPDKAGALEAEDAWRQSIGRILAEASKIQSAALLRVGFGGSAIFSGVDTSLDLESDEYALAPQFQEPWAQAVKALVDPRSEILAESIATELTIKNLCSQLGIEGLPIKATFTNGTLLYDALPPRGDYVDATLGLTFIGQQFFRNARRSVMIHKDQLSHFTRHGRELYGQLTGQFYEVRRGGSSTYITARVIDDMESRVRAADTRIASLESDWVNQWRPKVSDWSLVTALSNASLGEEIAPLVQAFDLLLLHIVRERAAQIRGLIRDSLQAEPDATSQPNGTEEQQSSISSAAGEIYAFSEIYKSKLNLRAQQPPNPAVSHHLEWMEDAWSEWSSNFPTVALGDPQVVLGQAVPRECRQLEGLDHWETCVSFLIQGALNGNEQPSPASAVRVLELIDKICLWETLPLAQVTWEPLDHNAFTLESLRIKLRADLEGLEAKQPWPEPEAFRTLATADPGKIKSIVRTFILNNHTETREPRLFNEALIELQRRSEELGVLRQAVEELLNLAPEGSGNQLALLVGVISLDLAGKRILPLRKTTLSDIRSRIIQDQAKTRGAIATLQSPEALELELSEWSQVVLGRLGRFLREVESDLDHHKALIEAPFQPFIENLEAVPDNLENYEGLLEVCIDLQKKSQSVAESISQARTIAQAINLAKREAINTLSAVMPRQLRPRDVPVYWTQSWTIEDLVYPWEDWNKSIHLIAAKVEGSRRLQQVRILKVGAPANSVVAGRLPSGQKFRKRVERKTLQLGPGRTTGPTLSRIEFSDCKDGEARILYLFAGAEETVFSPNWWEQSVQKWRMVTSNEWRERGGEGPFLLGPSGKGSWRAIQLPARFQGE